MIWTTELHAVRDHKVAGFSTICLVWSNVLKDFLRFRKSTLLIRPSAIFKYQLLVASNFQVSVLAREHNNFLLSFYALVHGSHISQARFGFPSEWTRCQGAKLRSAWNELVSKILNCRDFTIFGFPLGVQNFVTP